MALCLNMFLLPNEHIRFLKANPQMLEAYLQGQQPDVTQLEQTLFSKVISLFKGSIEQTIPEDWPLANIVMIGPEVDHRNVDLHHYIVNNTEARVKGAGSVFQTWLDISHHDAIKMDAANESFAFQSHVLPELQQLLSELNEQTVRDRFDAWLFIHNPDYQPQAIEYQQLWQGYQRFKLGVSQAVEQNLGLMWVTQ
ncbi:hypothetical protein MSG37_05970 [Shewanella sp. 1CM18E]|uniref:hypothetical protein n=1 Tax=Shewanella sp. 1CM18E TaxID=2929169 RepID=UPI0020BF0BE4|nr:hypothetical protein [Shewanella sp. 1CM18E]MCK8044424.1 hypothetical protein [Shewanella sp. 1CM18E]